MKQIAYCQQGRHGLAGNRRHRSAHHSPVQDEYGYGVQYHIDDTACKRRQHGELRAAVRPYDGIHRIGKQEERDTDDKIFKILLCICDVVFRGPEPGQHRLLQEQESCRQQQAGRRTHHDCISHALVGPLFILHPLADA